MKHLTAKRYAHLREIEVHEIGRPHFRLPNALVNLLGDFRAEPIWDDYHVAASTACTVQTLFSIPQGNQYTIPGGATYVKTLQDTSMENARNLPSPERMLVRSICVYLDNTMNQADVAQLLSQTIIQLKISTKVFFQVPLAGKLPAGGGAWAQQAFGPAAAAVQAGVTGNGLPTEAGGGYPLTQPGVQGSNQDGSDSFPPIEGLLIAQNQNFGVVVDPTQAAWINATGVGFTTAATTAYAPGVGVNLWVLLEGTHVVAVL